MKMAFVVHSEYRTAQVMQLLKETGIDYYTRWDQALGKGPGTDPHLGSGAFGSTNTVLMIAFEDEQPLHRLIARIQRMNAEVKRGDDKIRLFQLPLECIV
jgi:hypothetical protein